MTIDEAIQELINSQSFKEKAKAKQEAKLRVYLSRINSKTDNIKMKIHLLEAFGYTVVIKSPSKKNTL